MLTAYRHCLLSTAGHGRVPAHMHRVSWRRLTSVASCRQTTLDMYLHTCFGKLAQHLPALRPIDNQLRLSLVSVELARRLPTLPPVDTRLQSCTCTHTRVSSLTAYRHCLLLITSHGCAHTPGQASASLRMLPPVEKQPWTCTWTHAVSWRSLYWRCVPLTIGSDWCLASWRSLLLTTGRGCVPFLHPLSTSHKCCTYKLTRASWHSTYRRHLEHAGNLGRSFWPRTKIVHLASCGCTIEPYACAYTKSGLTPFSP